MPNYLPQADPSGNCCDCSVRTDPCAACGVCFNSTGHISVVISNITLGCGCVNVTQASTLAAASWKETSFTGINGTFTVPNTYSGTGFCGYQLNNIGQLTANLYNGVIDCSNTPGSSTKNVNLLIEIDNNSGVVPNGIYILVFADYTLGGSLEVALFYKVLALGSGLGSIPNPLNCGDYISDAFETNAQAVNSGGTISITI